jgi:hypothetical protein
MINVAAFNHNNFSYSVKEYTRAVQNTCIILFEASWCVKTWTGLYSPMEDEHADELLGVKKFFENVNN